MKKIGIMQPYFFPYIGYFSLIKHTDTFILFDTVNFIRHGWIERNRILKQGGDWLYVKVPLINNSQNILIKDAKINNNQEWREKIIAQLQTYKKTAPYYNDVINIVKDIFSKDYENITLLNAAIIQSICGYLDIKCNLSIFSEMNLKIQPANAPDEWALNICKALGGIDEYWNPPGGQSFFDKSKYDNAGVKLVFQKPILEEYDQHNEKFIAGLSIIDVMMFNSPEDVNRMLDKYELI